MKDNFFIYVGNAYPHKNVELLMRAASEAGVKVVYVGNNDFFYRRLNITPKTVSDKELTALYRRASALVFPSLMEGFGLPVLEALREGCPVIASDIPVFHELYSDAITYFDPRDAEALAQRLQSPPQRTPEFLKRAKSVASKFSWKKMAHETLSLYETCARL